MTESEQFKQIVCTMYDTFRKKNHDYGNSFSTTWQEFGSLGLVTAVAQISHKYHRLLNLTKGTQPKVDENIRDTLLDLSNYCILTVMELDKEKAEGRF